MGSLKLHTNLFMTYSAAWLLLLDKHRGGRLSCLFKFVNRKHLFFHFHFLPLPGPFWCVPHRGLLFTPILSVPTEGPRRWMPYHHSNARPETIVTTTTMNPSCRVGRGRLRSDWHVAEPDADLIDLEKRVLET